MAVVAWAAEWLGGGRANTLLGRKVRRGPFCEGEGDALVALLRGARASARMSPPHAGTRAHAVPAWPTARSPSHQRAPELSEGSHPQARNLSHHVHLLVGDCEARL